jgi:deazaflavin-dependent oxidoreductase (nitroreductase family)
VSEALSRSDRFWRSRTPARLRHALAPRGGLSVVATKMHARLVVWSGGRIRRSFLFTGGMPILLLSTTGRKSGRRRLTPVGYLPHGGGYAILASNAGSDRPPAWWLNLEADPRAEVTVGRDRVDVTAAEASAAESDRLWEIFARMNPGFDEYRRLTKRRIPVVLLRPRQRASGT